MTDDIDGDKKFARQDALLEAMARDSASPLHSALPSRAGAPIPLAELLAFEEAHPGRAGRKENAIRLLLRISAVRYYQQLNAAIDTPEALEHNPMLVNRLRDKQQARKEARAALQFRLK